MLQTAPAPSSTVPLPLDLGQIEVCFHRSIDALGVAEWHACFPDEIENHAYHRALEKAAIPGFELGWYAVKSNGQLICAAPAFTTSYDLATTAQGIIARVLKALQRLVPGNLTLKLSCLGSPATEYCQFGFHRSLTPDQCDVALTRLMDFWTRHAFGQGAAVRGMKDVRGQDRTRLAGLFAAQGFHAVTSLPSAYLPIEFGSMAGYLELLSSATRKDMRRKLKQSSAVEIEFTTQIGAVIDDITAMYRETRARSDWDFEDLPAAYFTQVIEQSPDTALFALYRVQGKLIGANLLLQNGKQLLDKFFLARSADSRTHNLYFLSWFTNVERCVQHGLDVYVSGAAGYDAKLKLASRLEPNWIYFKHRNWLANALLRTLSPFLAVTQPQTKPLDQRGAAS